MSFIRFYRLPFLILVGLFSHGIIAQSERDDLKQWQEFDSLVNLANNLPDDSLVRKSFLLHEAGKVADGLDEILEAIEVTNRALELRLADEQLTGDGVLISAMNLGLYYSKTEEYREALDHFGMILNRAPNRKEGVVWFQIARIYGETGEFAAGEQAFLKAASLPPFSEAPSVEAILQQELGVLHLGKNNEEGGAAAIGPLKRSLAFFVDDGNGFAEMDTRNYLGWAYTETGEYDIAIRYLKEALRLAEELEAYDEEFASIYSNLGFAYRRKGEIELAIKNHEEALRLQIAADDDPSLAAISLNNLSTAYLQQGNVGQALDYAQAALSEAIPGYQNREISDLPEVGSINKYQLDVLVYLMDLARGHAASATAESYGLSLAAYRRADELLDAMRRGQLLEDTRNYWRADARELYDEAIQVATAADDPASAFYFMEKARARLLLDEVSASRAEALLPDNLLIRLTESSRGARLNPEEPVLLQRFSQLQDSILTAFPEYARQRMGTAPPKVSDLPKIVGDNCLIEYYVSGGKTMALVFDKENGLRTVELAAPSVWEPLLWGFRRELSNPKIDFDPVVPRALCKALIDPLNLPLGKSLIIVPDGELYLLPFGALLTTLGEGESSMANWSWLARDRKVNYAFSLQLLELGRRQSGRGNGKALALAPVARINATDGLSQKLELPATLRTVRHLAGLLPTDTLINAAANRTAFKGMADDYSLLHLGTHAYLEEGGSFLLHGNEEKRYSVNDLLEHSLKADLVVIGACETGLGKQIIGEGVASLGRGFARRGAPGLVMSLWSIDDATTAGLLNRTYDGLASGNGPGKALHAAVNNYLKEGTNPRFAHPYYWAGLVHYGPEEPLSFVGQKSGWWYWVLGAVMALSMLVFLAWRKG